MRRTSRGRALPVVVASDRSHRFGVVVDRFLGERDIRVSPLDARLGKVPNIDGTSVLENDWPVLIVDIEDLIRSVRQPALRPSARQAHADSSARNSMPARQANPRRR